MTEPYDLVIENGTIWSPTSAYKADIAVRAGKIVAIGGPFPIATKRIDARGHEVMPGIWHVHCHFREPGLCEHRRNQPEGFRSARPDLR